MTLKERIAELLGLSTQLLTKDLSDSEYWLIKGEIETSKKALYIIKTQKQIIEMQSSALTKIKEWRKPDSGFGEICSIIPYAMEGVAEGALKIVKQLTE